MFTVCLFVCLFLLASLFVAVMNVVLFCVECFFLVNVVARKCVTNFGFAFANVGCRYCGCSSPTCLNSLFKQCVHLFFKGILSAWDTRQNKCFMHWEADTAEISKYTLTIGLQTHGLNEMRHS